MNIELPAGATAGGVSDFWQREVEGRAICCQSGPSATSSACTTRLRSMPSQVSHPNASTAVALRPTVIGGSFALPTR